MRLASWSHREKSSSKFSLHPIFDENKHDDEKYLQTKHYSDITLNI